MVYRAIISKDASDCGKEWTISEVVDSFGLTRHTWATFFLLSFALIFDGYDFMIVNSTNIFVARTFWPDVANPATLMGSLTTWGLLGMVLGGAISGVLSDMFGRKKVLILAVVFYGLFTLPQAFANDLAFFAAFRLIAGLGVGSCIPIVYTVFSEVFPSNRRGFFITLGGAFMVGGWVIAGLVANPICNAAGPLLGSFTNEIAYTASDGLDRVMYSNWRLCYIIGAIPLVYAVFLGFFMKESPHWCANSGRVEEAVSILGEFELRSTGRVTKRDPKTLVVPPRPKKTTPNILFSNKFIVGTCACWATYFVAQFCVYGMNAWLPSWFVSLGYSSSEAVALQTWNNAAAIVANSVVGYISDRAGRRNTLIGGWVFCIIVIILCSVLVAPNSFLLCLALMLAFGAALNFCISAIVPLMPEQYPTAVRNTGVAWCQAFARFGGSASSIVLGGIAAMSLFQVDGVPNWSSIVLVLIVPFALGLITTVLFVAETGGASFDELAANSAADEGDDGKVPFATMIVLIVILFALCIVCPLAVPGWSQLPMALPLMATGMLLPMVFFFVEGFRGKARQK